MSVRSNSLFFSSDLAENSSIKRTGLITGKGKEKSYLQTSVTFF